MSTLTASKPKAKAKAKESKPLTAEQKATRQEAYLQSDYYNKVNKVNAQAKVYTKTFSGARAILLKAHDEKKEVEGMEFEMPTNFASILRASKKDKRVYRHAMENVRTYKSKAGESYGTHTVLQWLKKFETELNDLIKSDLPA